MEIAIVVKYTLHSLFSIFHLRFRLLQNENCKMKIRKLVQFSDFEFQMIIENQKIEPIF